MSAYVEPFVEYCHLYEEIPAYAHTPGVPVVAVPITAVAGIDGAEEFDGTFTPGLRPDAAVVEPALNVPT
jgi:hypothetical protein